MDFLLECIGFPPGYDLSDLERAVVRGGERVVWRGPRGQHLRYPLPGGLEVRLDREEGQEVATLWPHYDVRHRLRVEVWGTQPLPDSPFDVLLHGLADPPLPGAEARGFAQGFPLSTYLSDARRLPAELRSGHVLAVSIAGFALDVGYVGPDEGAGDPAVAERPHGALLAPLGEDDEPGGCMEVSLRIRRVRHLSNPLTGVEVDVLEADAPGRPLELFYSPWQLASEDLERPRPGWRIEGAFLFTGRVSGGLPSPRRRAGRSFG
jgi:hypothetical protein